VYREQTAREQLALRLHLLQLFQLLIMSAGHVVKPLPVGLHFLLKFLRQLLHSRHASH
jgi:hypothetical protein